MSQHQPPRGHQHVVPRDPVVQRVKPELRFLLGLLTTASISVQRLSAAARFQISPPMGSGGLSVFEGRPLSSVVGLLSKRISLLLQKTRIWQGSFAPQELPRFPATMTPSDSRLGRGTVMVSHQTLNWVTPRFRIAKPGLSGSRVDLSTPAVPYHPEGPDRCMSRCFTSGIRLHLFRKVAIPICVTRRRVRLR